MLVELSVILEVERINPETKRHTNYGREQRIVSAIERSMLPQNTRILLIHKCCHPGESDTVVPFFGYNHASSAPGFKAAYFPKWGVLRHFGYMLICETDAPEVNHLFGNYPIVLTSRSKLDNGAKAVLTVCGGRRLSQLPQLHEVGQLTPVKGRRHSSKLLFA